LERGTILITEPEHSSTIDLSNLSFAAEDFETFFVRHPSPSFLVEPVTGRLLAANLAAEALYGWSAAEFASMTTLNLRPPRARAEAAAHLERLSVARGSARFLATHWRKDGEPMDVEVLTQPMSLGGRDVRRAVIVDVTARTRAEALFRGVADQALTGIYVIQDGRFIYLNPRLAEIFGCTVDELLREREPLALLPSEIRDELARRGDSQTSGHNKTVHYSLRTVRRDGTQIEIEIYGSALTLHGRPALAGTVLDTTERLTADAALRESEERFRGAFDKVMTGMAITAPDGRWLRVNPALCEMLGYTAAEMLEHTFQSVTYPEDLPRNLVLLDALLRGEIPGYRMDKRFVHKNGSLVWSALSVSLVRSQQGEPLYMVAQTLDITDRKRAEAALDESEAQLRHAQKMEAVGRLAGGVAHDFNNLLTVIGSNAEIGADLAAEGIPAPEELAEIRSAVERAAALTRQLLAFSRRQVLAPSPIAINEVVADAERMLRRVIGEDVTLDTRLDEYAGDVVADRGQLEQVLMNLVVNARDAMPNGGRIVIETRCGGRGQVAISVTDDGHGMDEVTRARAFEPFFTTKELGKGTGLGLSTVYGITRQSGGDVAITSAPAMGTTVTVTLPMQYRIEERSAAATAGTTGDPELIEGVGDTILLVEDEPGVRAVAKKILGRLGYRVVEAANGADALFLWTIHRSRVKLVLTDAVMPLMGGRELAERLREVGADVPVLFMSGYADGERGGEVPAGAPLIGKPFSAETLRERVGALLRERRG
jgi:PAS domain S-box-containing protein